MSARDVYDARGFGGRQGAGERPAVVVVDFIEGFTNPESALACDADAASRRPGRCSTRPAPRPCRCSSRPLPTARTTSSAPRCSSRRRRRSPRSGPALRWIEVDARLGRRAEEPVLVKLFASAFFGTNLDELLRDAGCDTVIVAGASTSGCVRATAVDALQYGYRVLVPREAVADRAVDAHNGSLLDIDAKYGDVISIGEAIAAVAARVLAGDRREQRQRHDRHVRQRARRLRRRVVGRDRRAPAPARRHPGARRLRPVRDRVRSRRAPRGVAPRRRRRAGRLRPHRRRAERELRAARPSRRRGRASTASSGSAAARPSTRRSSARSSRRTRESCSTSSTPRSAAASRFPGRCFRSSPCRRPPARDPRSRRSRSSTSRGWGRRPASRTSTSGRRSRSSTPP